jgi:probable O-glycosylation ligase (exosortase A-associated)
MWFMAKELSHSQVIGGFTFLGYVLSKEQKVLLKHRESVLICLLWVFFGLTTVFAIEQVTASEKFILLSKMFFMVLLSTSIVSNEKRIRLLVRVMAAAVGLFGLKGGLFFLSTGGQEMVSTPDGSFLSGNNAVGLALAMNLPVLLYLAKTDPQVWLRWLFRVMLIASYPAILGTFSRGAWAAAAIVTLLLFWNSGRKTTVLIAIGAFGVLTMWFPGILSSMLSERVIDRYETLENIDTDNTSQSRLWSWEFCKRVALDNPVIGAGFGYYSEDTYAKYYPEMLSRWPGKSWSCHNSWLQVLGEHGFIGFSLWCALLICTFSSLRDIRLYGRALPEMVWAVDIGRMLPISLVGFMVGGTFLDFAYFEGFYQLVAVVVVTKEIVFRKWKERTLSEARHFHLSTDGGKTGN